MNTLPLRLHLAIILAALVMLTGAGQAAVPVDALAAEPPPPRAYLPLVALLPSAGPNSCRTWPTGSHHLLLSPAYERDHVIYLAGYEGRSYIEGVPVLYRSNDRGRSWMQLPTPPTEYWDPPTLSREFEQDQTLYASMSLGDEWGIARSTDGGETWEPRSQQPGPGSTELVAVNRDTVFLTLAGGVPYQQDELQGFYRSEDGGTTWTGGGGDAENLTVSPTFPQDKTILIQYVGYHWSGPPARSTDGGWTWHPVGDGIYLPTAYGYLAHIRFSPAFAQDQTVFIIASERLYRTTNGGDRWHEVWWDWARYPDLKFQNLFVSPRYPEDHTLWAMDYVEGWLRSRDDGQTWEPVFKDLSLEATGQYCQADGHCGVELLGWGWNPDSRVPFLVRSFDGGYTWRCLEDSYQPPL